MKIWRLLIRYCNEGEAFEELVDSCVVEWMGGISGDINTCLDFASGRELDELAKKYRTPLTEMLRWFTNPTDKVLGRKHLAFLEEHGTQIKMAWPYAGYDPNGEAPIFLDRPVEMGSVISPVCKFIKDQIDLHDESGIPLPKALPIGTCKFPECGRLVLVKKIRIGGIYCSSDCKGKRQKKQNAEHQKEYRNRNIGRID
jgi:hypothetical protein